MKNTLDIIIPHYNDPRVLDSIKSVVFHPDRSKMKIILMDAYSPKDLKKKIKKILRPQDIHIEKKDKGIFDGINNGLRLSQSEWIGWIGSDDLLNQNFRLNFLDLKLDGYFASTVFYDSYSKKLLLFFYPLIKKNFITVPHFSSFLKRELALKYSFDNNLVTCADFFYFFKINKFLNKIKFTKDISVFMCAGGTSNSSIKQILSTNLLIFKILLKNKNFFASLSYIFIKIFIKIYGKTDVIFRKIFRDPSFIKLENSLINFYKKIEKK